MALVQLMPSGLPLLGLSVSYWLASLLENFLDSYSFADADRFTSMFELLQ